MRDDVYVYLRDDLPPNINEMVSPNTDGTYTILINARLNDIMRLDAYNHAVKHIENGDFDIDNVDTVDVIELHTHGIPGEAFKRNTRRKIRRKSAKVKFLEDSGYDFFAAAERRYLEP